MKKNFVFGIILATTMGLSPSVGSAEGITGFQDFQFGMSLSDVQEIANLTPTSRDHRGQWYEASPMVTIMGDEYAQRLLFNDAGILTGVNLTREFADGRVACKGALDRAFGAIGLATGNPINRLKECQTRFGKATQPVLPRGAALG